MTLANAGGTVSYRYDPFGRRIQKSGPSGTSNFVYDEWNVLEEVDNAGNIEVRYTETENLDEPLSQVGSGGTGYYHQDVLGSVTSLSNAAAALAQTYTFNAFGKLAASSGSITNPFQFAGREFDSETGSYYHRARYYDPGVGRFISEDPLGFVGSGPNSYAYVFDNPTNLVDPFGLAPGDWWDPRSYDFSHTSGRDVLQDVGNTAEAFTDAITFGSASRLNDALGAGHLVNRCGIGHKLGSAAGITASIAIGAGVGAEAAEANAGREGFEFSHWIPKRMGGGRSIYNGNYVSQGFHYLIDPFRYPSGWQALGPKLPAVAQQLLRIPWIYDGAAAGAAWSGAGAKAGRNCGCH